jgi:hypothetical protein
VRNEVGAGCKSPRPHLSEGRGKHFFLDIPFHRMGVMGLFCASAGTGAPIPAREKVAGNREGEARMNCK